MLTKQQEKIIDEVFKSLQLMSYYELYYTFDFSVQRVKNFNSIMEKKNLEMKRDLVYEYEKTLKRNIGFDCVAEAKRFPMRPKMQMAKVNPRDFNRNREVIDIMISTYLVIAIKTLRENYRFNAVQVQRWWDSIREMSHLYTQKEPLTDAHIVKYFNQECKLPIYFEGDEQDDRVDC